MGPTKPCPWCHGTNCRVGKTIHTGAGIVIPDGQNGLHLHHVECLDCLAHGPEMDTKEAAVSAWEDRK